MPSLIVPAAYLLVAILIGLCGRKLRFGFWGMFFATLLFTPVIGLLLLLASGGGPANAKAN